MEASAMLLLEREHRVHDTDSLLHEFLLVFHKSSVIRVHQLIIYIKSQEVCLPLYRRMRQMDKDGKKMVAEFVYRHAVWAHPTNPVEGCADANPKTMLPNDT